MSGPEPDVQDAQAKAAAIRRSRPAPAAPGPLLEPGEVEQITYPGLATRTIAFAIDGAVINGVAIAVGIAIGLGVSILHMTEKAEIALGVAMGALYVIWSITYFIFFWSTSGQTPGDRVMRIRVVDARHHRPLRPVRAAIRFGGLILAGLPLLAGFLIMLWDDRRRCLQDRLAHTVVIDALPPGPSPLTVAGNGSAPEQAQRRGLPR